jgi:glycosyltransferase involved in cell wall biosynthesis
MKHNTKTLIILSPGFPKDEADNTCLPLQQSLVKSLNKNYDKLKIIILAFEYPFTKASYKWNGNTVICFNAWKKGKIKKVSIAFSVWRTLNQLKRKYSIVGIFSFWYSYGALIGKCFAKKNTIKHYIWILGQDAKRENKYVRWLKPQPNELVALSEFAANEFYKNHSVLPSHIIPPGIDPSQFAKKPNERDIDISGAGSLIALKQYNIFIEVIFKLKKIFPGIKTMICGKGIDEKNLKELINSSELNENVFLTGEMQHAEVLSLMQRTKIFLHPSAYEGFGVACLEALYAGCHVISFIKPMHNDTDHWHIVETKEEMVKKAVELLETTGTEYTKVLPYTIDDCAKNIIQLFNYKETATS